MTLPFAIPVLETERLILRAPRESDLDAMAAFGASDRSRFVGGPMTRLDCWRGLLASVGHWAMRGYGFFAVELRETGAMAGRVGVIYHDGWDEPELGWHVYDGFEGKGIAREAALAARGFAATRGLGPLISYIAHENHRSRALALRLGAVLERQGTVAGHPCDVFRHPQGAA